MPSFPRVGWRDHRVLSGSIWQGDKDAAAEQQLHLCQIQNLTTTRSYLLDYFYSATLAWFCSALDSS
jgi:hypothetical protein